MAHFPREMVAIHESAHAVCSIKCSHATLAEVTIEPTGETLGATTYRDAVGRVSPVAAPPREDDDPPTGGIDLGDDKTLIASMAVTLAGRAATLEWGWSREMSDAAADGDFRIVATIALGLSDRQFVRGQHLARARADHLVRRYRREIDAVAAALLASPTGRLTGQEVETIVDRFLPAPDPAEDAPHAAAEMSPTPPARP